ncbi:hypothetical protein IQ252_03320 [Tychonema sp. LEGE 07203]|nr:hypothetical protein [Tychonema sp. LEGE 07203]
MKSGVSGIENPQEREFIREINREHLESKISNRMTFDVMAGMDLDLQDVLLL